MADELDPRITHSLETYDEKTLRIYDTLVLRLFCPLVWGCGIGPMRRLYDRSVGRRHLDVGPGTGYFVDKTRWRVKDPEITLLDLNTECLTVSARRLARFTPETCQANLLDPLPLPPDHFDSVGLNLVLHCIPGGWEEKGIIFEHLAKVVRPGGRIFGTTILAEGVPMNAVTHRALLEQHERGNFQNQGDDPDGLRRQLRRYLPDHQLVIKGTTALFRAVVA
jgi:SAM-dependent methyltransferase